MAETRKAAYETAFRVSAQHSRVFEKEKMNGR